MGADRVDLLGGDAGFVLTPFLVLTPLLLVGEAVRLLLFRVRLRPPGAMAWHYTALLLTLLCLALASGLLGLDVGTSTRRALHLVAMSGGTLAMAAAVWHRAWLNTALARGAELGLILAVVFNVGQILALTSDGLATLHLGPATIGLEAGRYAGIVPRLSGQIADPNRAGFVFLFYIFALFLGSQPGTRRRVGVFVGLLSIFFTLSRSAALSGAMVLSVGMLAHSELRVSRRALLTGCLIVGSLCAAALVSPSMRQASINTLKPLSGRLSLQEGSAQDHAHLFQRGLEEGTHSVRRAALGVGYGNSYRTLQDVFPGNKYGNFHSLYLTLLVESGVFALLVVLLMLAGPIAHPGPLLPMVAGLWLFNVFYQASTEPTFWFILALAWLTSIRFSREERCYTAS